MGRLAHIMPPFTSIDDEVDRLIEGAFDFLGRDTGGLSLPAAIAYPPLNISEEGDVAYVESELPGLAMDQVEVLVCGDQLTIRGERPGAIVEGQWHRRERPLGAFSRSVTLPWDVTADAVEARLRDGMLTIKLPKSERSRARKVEVHAV